jgi:hypothetical protein
MLFFCFFLSPHDCLTNPPNLVSRPFEEWTSTTTISPTVTTYLLHPPYLSISRVLTESVPFLQLFRLLPINRTLHCLFCLYHSVTS